MGTLRGTVLGIAVAVIGAGAFVLDGCSSDEAKPGASDGGGKSDATGGGGGNDAASGGGDAAGPMDAGGGGDGGDAEIGQTYAVPAAGGTVQVQGTTTPVSFTFPASAGGKSVTFAATTPAAIGWPTDQFTDVIEMKPEGTRFSEPVLVKVGKAATVMSFADTGAAKSAASPLPYDAARGGFELRHFSRLVIVPPGKTCDSEGVTDSPDSGRCDVDGGTTATTFRMITCKGYSYCLHTAGSCCVAAGTPADAGCTTENQKYGISVTPTDTNGGQYPYCQVDAGDWDGGDGGCGGSGVNYAFGQNGGCSVARDCGPYYQLLCDGAQCTCKAGQTTTRTFAQSTSCDTGATMGAAFVRECNFPLR